MYTIEAQDAVWVKSSRSTNGNCVEVARLGNGRVAVRDSKSRQGPVLVFAAGDWRAFMEDVKSGGFGA